MNTQSLQLYTLGYNQAKTYLAVAVFVAGNILLPRLFHLASMGGPTWLPIYFFTLVAACKYGWKAGLLTALLSPLANSLLFGMPSSEVLPAIMVKSVLLALIAAFAAKRFAKVSLPILAGVVLSYQVIGALAGWSITGSFPAAVQGFLIAWPGMLLQIFGGYLLINYLIRK